MPSSKQSQAVKRLAHEESYRLEAKEAYEKHTASTGKLDILQRCKKLNEFLSNDFLKQGPENKEQLKEMLAILNSGPKRPSFLDKPPVTSSIGKKSAASSTSTTSCTLNSVDAEKLLGYLSQEESAASRCNMDTSPSKSNNKTIQPEDVDDVIGLLNAALTSSAHPSSQYGPGVQDKIQGATTQEKMDEERRKAQEKALEKKKQKQEEERMEANAKREEEETKKREAEQRLKEEVLRKRKEEARRAQLEEAEKRRQKEELKKFELQRASALSKLQESRNNAATLIQRYVKGHLARIKVAAMRSRSHAAVVLQSLHRALLGRRHLQDLRVQDFIRRRAARCIALQFIAYKKKWRLGPLHEPVRGGAPAVLDGHAHLLNKPLRLRSMADARSAPEAAGSAGRITDSGVEDAALGASTSSRRAVACIWLRADHMTAEEDRLKEEVETKTLMVRSEHRCLQDAMNVVKGGSFGAKMVASGSGGSHSSSKGSSRPGSSNVEKSDNL
ncbi:hypothetical protein CEUSTIGMA_g12171.t1 [Chlamydomonas eustigma]|uniref:Uncharacterized protein n=1 Tax=Chlamydomonas eustigma TaxID=1157962 RepID=A0A250XP79_9CHLO|nr:hypothetical protein CEUSTIGMA_g12171.t1 [Chlamydomonas eustigma]|eukprot:GAX84749.1 hypothetical protein CEUSTIGMA_g12171.t1 [Chlamydomonas eustigma]